MAFLRFLFLAFALGLGGLSLLGAPARSQEAERQVLLSVVDGVIGPPSAWQIGRAIEEAEARDGEILIVQINTPGGLETSMRDIIEDILAARIPVIGYVAPSGGRAASAGTYIMYATHVAAMAPGTNIGAATPVQLQGGAQGQPETPNDASEENSAAPVPPGDALERKAVNDAAAFLRSLADLRGRNAQWGEQAVRSGAAISAREALELNVIEIVAGDLDDLLDQLDGRAVETRAGARTLATAGRSIVLLEPSLLTNVLSVLANPNVAFLLMMVGVYGIIFEFANPGSIGPGVVGVVALTLGLYALNLLDLNFAGLALIGFGIAFMIAEAFTPTFGVLGIGGAVAFVLGALMLIDTDIPEYQLHWGVIAAGAALTGGFIALALGVSLRAHRRKVKTGCEGLIGVRAKVEDWSAGEGHVWAEGERWRACGPPGLKAGDWVIVTRIEALTLDVAAESPTGA